MHFSFKALRAVRRARFWDHAVLYSFVFRCLTVLEFCIIFDTLLRPWSVFWSHFCYFIIIWGALLLHFLHQEFNWSAKAAKGGAKVQNANIPLSFWRPFWTQFSDIPKTQNTFCNFFSRRCSSHVFLVSFCTFSEDFSTPFVWHVICARSDFDCTGIAQSHVMTSERSEKLQNN